MEMSNLNRMDVNKEESDQTDLAPALVTSNSVVNQRMTIAGGFLDIALFVSNVEHLKFIYDTGKEDIEYYDLLLAVLFTSLSLQVLCQIIIVLN